MLCAALIPKAKYSQLLPQRCLAVGQKAIEPTAASLIMSLESVFSVIFGWLLLKQGLSIPELLGCALVFAGVILAQLPIKRKRG